MRTAPQYDVGVVVGRFQVPSLHTGHVDLLRHVKSKHDKVIVVLGVPPTINTVNNPLDYEARAQMIQQRWPEFVTLPLLDSGSDSIWSQQLDALITSVTKNQSVLLYGGRDSFLKSYSGKFPTEELVQAGHKSGTEIREECRRTVRSSEDFRAGVIWGPANRFPTVYTTVDIAIFGPEGLLMGRKADETQWRFIGGFADPASDSFEEDAIREALEETGLHVKKLEYVGSFRVEDWRYRSEIDKIKTVFYSAEALPGQQAVAADDIAEVAWFESPDDLLLENVVESHRPLMVALIEKYGDDE